MWTPPIGAGTEAPSAEVAISEGQAEAHQFLTKAVVPKPGVKLSTAQMVGVVQKQSPFGEGFIQFPKFCAQSRLIQLVVRRQVEAFGLQ